MIWHRRTIVLFLASATAGLCVDAARQQTTPEYRLEAAFLGSVPFYVEWPSSAWDHRTAVQLCVLRPIRFGALLQEAVAGQRMGSRPMVIREIDADDPVSECHVLFIGLANDATVRALLHRTARLPILTVGDEPAFLDAGGVIALLDVRDGRVRFDVSAEAAGRAGLKISSQLLRLARTVRGAPS
jgi:hypothetical protein